jgi:hypothetical protein
MPRKSGNGWPGKGSSLKGGRKGTRGRSSVTGKFVKKSYAKKHPKTTEIERIKKRGK